MTTQRTNIILKKKIENEKTDVRELTALVSLIATVFKLQTKWIQTENYFFFFSPNNTISFE